MGPSALAGVGLVPGEVPGVTAESEHGGGVVEQGPATRAYAQRRTEEGLSHREIARCIKRYHARGLVPILIADLAELT